MRCEIRRTPLWNNARTRRGPFDIIGDLHGCADELRELLDAGSDGSRTDWSKPEEPWGGEVLAAPGGSPRDLPGRSGGSRPEGARYGPHCSQHGGRERRVLRAGQSRREVHALAARQAGAGEARAGPIDCRGGVAGQRRAATGWRHSWTDWSATTCWMAADWWSRTRGCGRRCTAAARARCASSASTARPRARPTSSVCRCGTTGRRSIAGRRRWSTATRRCRNPSG